MRAAWTDLGAAGHRIPSRFRPLDRSLRQAQTPLDRFFNLSEKKTTAAHSQTGEEMTEK